jgi:ATP-dependent helicase/nuclease subunit A
LFCEKIRFKSIANAYEDKFNVSRQQAAARLARQAPLDAAAAGSSTANPLPPPPSHQPPQPSITMENKSAPNITFTPQQQSAIDYNAENPRHALVFAAAGSGKTAVLVRRLTRIIADSEHPTPAHMLTAVTFTRKAAAELRERLETSVARLIADNPEDQWLKSQLVGLSAAHIGTIDAFCLDLVRLYASVAENSDPSANSLSAGLNVLDEDLCADLSRRAMRQTMEDYYDPGLFTAADHAALSHISDNTNDSGIAKAVLALDRLLERLPAPEEWLRDKTCLFADHDGLFALLIDKLRYYTAVQAKRQLSIIDRLIKISNGTKVEQMLQKDRTFIAELTDYDFTRKDAADELIVTEFPRAVWKGNEDLKAEIDPLRKKWKDFRTKTCANNAYRCQVFGDMQRRLSAVPGVLIKLREQYQKRYHALKANEGGMDFADVTRACLNLLRDNPSIAADIANETAEIICDEFQDSNEIQYEIFRLIAAAGKTRLFFVGDVKQSIYRFRGGNPKVFTALAENPAFAVLHLDRNFRSLPGVVDAVNELFCRHMTKALGGVDYNSEGEKLVCGVAVPAQDDSNENKPDHKAEFAVLPEGYGEPEYIACRIKHMVESGFPVADKTGLRPCRYGDFAVLSSSLSGAEDSFVEAFQRQGVPIARSKGGDYLARREIAQARAFLSVVDNPYNDEDLLCVLMSPMYDLSAAELAELRLKPSSPLVADVKRSQNPKAERFIADYLKYTAVAADSSAILLIRTLLEDGLFTPLAAASPFPRSAMANLRLLAQMPCGDLPLSALSHWFRGRSLSIADLSDADAVGLYTIHAAKGLEFPVVFLAGAGKSFNLKDEYPDTLIDEQLGFCFTLLDNPSHLKFESLAHACAQFSLHNDSISEEMRKLYVACTRAKTKLIITANAPKRSDNFYKWIEECTESFAHIIPDMPPEPEESQSESEQESTELQPEDKGCITPKILPYAREILTTVPIKLTATQIAIEKDRILDTEDEPSVFPRLPSFMKNTGLTGKKRGDAYHKAMNLLDFRAGHYAEQLENLRSRFTAEEFDAVNIEDILRFFESDLGRRAAKAERVEKEFPLYTEVNLSDIGLPVECDLLFPGEKPFVQGVADMFFFEHNGIILVDYKTNRRTTAEKLRTEYTGQLAVYTKAIEEMTGLPVKERWIYSFEIGAVRL